jgi:AcrR family transcriptional regulator
VTTMARGARAARVHAGREAPSRGGTPGSTRRAPDEARRSILAAAGRLFYAQGIGAVGVDAVAAAARVTKRTLYYHFAAKDDLVAAYLEARDEETLRALDATAGRTGRPGDRILAVFDHVERWAGAPDYHGCPFNNAVAEQAVSPRTTALARRHKMAVRAWFTGRAAEGGAEVPEALGSRLLVLLDGALNGAAVFGSPEPAGAARAAAEALLDVAGVVHARGGQGRR